MSERPRIAIGDELRVRGARWRVEHLVPHGACTVVELVGAEPSNRGERARFLLPFEPFDRLPRRGGVPKLVRVAAWRRRARSALAAATPSWTSLRAPVLARITLLPYQLEPAIALVRGLACRLLLADDVGLGKTVQAGVIVAELLSRDPDARILIVTPAALREQWRDELAERFGIEAAVVDAAALATAPARFAAGVNPWSVLRVALTSIDFLKRPDVIRSIEPLVWDLVALDEAHALSGRSDRATAAEVVARRGRRVVTITATPHSGDERAFDRLCGLGRLGSDDPLLLFRRSRSDAGVPGVRTVRSLAVRLDASEIRMHRALEEYARRVARDAPPDSAAAARLAMIVLARRACSSPASLARSLERRLMLLAAPPGSTALQLRLPIQDGVIADDDEPAAELAAPGLPSPGAERRLLERLLDLAQATESDAKLAFAARLLRRCREPAILFTQYRDTLQHAASRLERAGITARAVIHGGMTAHERSIEARRFTHGDAAVLVATDAASEGLNLHRRSRLVVNLDVPWTPLRLEQRIGRVDRLGQTRRVHGILLVARGTSDAAAAAGLASRRGVACRAAPFDGRGNTAPPGVCVVSLRAEAREETARLVGVRALVERNPASTGRPVLAVTRRGERACFALRLRFSDGEGAPIWETIVAPITTAGVPAPRSAGSIREWLRTTIDDNTPALAASTSTVHELLNQRLRAEIARSLAALVRREREILAAYQATAGRMAAPLLQPGLFDRRAQRDAHAQAALAEAAAQAAADRAARYDRMQRPHPDGRELVFAVVL